MGENLLAQIRASNPDIVHARSDERGYTVLDVKPERMVAEMRTTANPVKADAQFGVQARFEIVQGVAGLHKL